MILDSDDVPEYDPVTGRFKFKKTAEEEEQEKAMKAGPPKMAAPQPSTLGRGSAGPDVAGGMPGALPGERNSF
jgi:hypothetical protein